PISVDTYKVDVAEAAVSAGARMINDIYGLRREPALAELAAHHNLPLVLMHIRGQPRTMQKNPRYDNLMGEIVDSLRRSVATALRLGVAPEALIIDPGIGFGKSWEDNLRILNRLVQLKTFGLPVLVGVSRKSFIGAVLGKESPKERLYGTLGASAAALVAGASAFRVHDPQEVRETLLVAAAVKQENTNVAG
ncbi:MAG: dihydropteroate synthase, partial [Planctomycetota bacterium]